MQLLDIEKEFDTIVPALGGKRVSSLIGQSPGFDNADYIFDDYGIVAELKCLRDNKLKDKELNTKILQLYKRWKARGLNIKASHDGWRTTYSNLPQECALEILKIYAKPIKKRIAKANAQIKQTKEKLSRKDYKGLLLLANDGNLAVDPEHVYHILSRSMWNGFSGINAVTFFTVNYPAKADFTNVDVLLWANLNRPGMEPISNDFFDMLSSAWSAHMEALLKTRIPSIHLDSDDDLGRLVNVNRDISGLL